MGEITTIKINGLSVIGNHAPQNFERYLKKKKKALQFHFPNVNYFFCNGKLENMLFKEILDNHHGNNLF